MSLMLINKQITNAMSWTKKKDVAIEGLTAVIRKYKGGYLTIEEILSLNEVYSIEKVSNNEYFYILTITEGIRSAIIKIEKIN